MVDKPEDEEITVQVEGEPAEKTASDASADPVADLKAQYDELQAQQKRDQEARQTAETARRHAEAARAQAEEAERTARTEAQDSRLGSIDQAIEAAKAAADAAQVEYQTALEAGDWKKAGDAQRRLSKAEAQTVQYEQNKALWEQQKVAPQVAQRQQPAGDPVDNYINQVAQQTPNSANWLRNHRDWITDSKKNAKLTAAHWDAMGEGIAVDTPEYFKHVEEKIGLNTPPPKSNGQDKSVTATARRSPPAPVASVAPSPGGTSGGGAEVRLTKNEAASATDGTLVWNYPDPTGQNRWKKGDPIGIQEMARRKRALQEKGEYDRQNYEA